MKIHENIAERLLAEFSGGQIRIRMLNKSYLELKDQWYNADNELEFSTEEKWEYEVIFNSDYIAKRLSDGDIVKDYREFLDRNRLDFYDEINELVNNSPGEFTTLNNVQTYKVRFEELIPFYSTKRVNRFDDIFVYYIHARYSLERGNDQKAIDEYHIDRIIHEFFSIQYTSLNQILNYLENKLSLLKEFRVEESKVLKRSKVDKKPIDRLDRYQVALLFQYLEDAGAIKTLDYSPKARAISELTGFSEQNLRTKCLNRIVEIRKGELCNSAFSTKPHHNLGIVKDLILEIQAKISRDLTNNFDYYNKDMKM